MTVLKLNNLQFQPEPIMLESWIIPGVFVTIFTWVIYKWLKRPRNFPPGPRGLPLLGSAHMLTSRPELDLMKMSKLYGPVMGIKIFGKLTVVISDADLLHQAFVKTGMEFSGRPNSVMFQTYSNSTGIVATTGVKWKEIRKLGQTIFRMLGAKGQVMENWILEEALYMCDTLQENKKKAILLNDLIMHSSANIICRLCFNERYGTENKEYSQGTRALFDWFAENSNIFMTLVFAPYLRFIPPFSNAVTSLKEAKDKVANVARGFITKHQESYDPNDCRGLVDAFIQDIEREKPGSLMNRDEMLGFVRDMFMAGTDTTVSSLCWLFIFLVNRPNVQKKIQREIDRVIGPDGNPKMIHLDEMHYTKAVFYECMRHRTPGPQGVPHRTIADTNLSGYNIPADTQIIANLWAIHHDPKLWEDPEEFKPERFLEDGKFQPSNKLLPFSIGARYCIGEKIAKMELFFFVVTVLQRFHMKPPYQNAPPIPEECQKSGLFLTPPKFYVMPRERFSRQRSINNYRESFFNQGLEED